MNVTDMQPKTRAELYAGIEEILNVIKNQTDEVPVSADILKRLHEETSNVVRFSLNQWQIAYEDAIDKEGRYDREDLLDLYEQIEIDEHVTALIDTIYNNIIANGFQLVDENGEDDPEVRALFERPWFSQYVAMAVDAVMHGFNGIQFTGVTDGTYSGCKLIPRRHILPLVEGIRYNDNQDIPDILFSDRSIFPWTSFLFPQLPADQYKLGKFNKIAKLFILKRENTQFWAMFNEIFGIPFRVMKTDISDNTRMPNAIAAMKSMTAASYAIIQTEDEVMFHNGVAASNTSTFKEFCERMDKGMSKALVGSTMVLEDGSSRSQGEVHERNTSAFVIAYQRIIEEWINEQVIPKMRELGFAVPEGYKFKWDNTETLGKSQIVELISKLNASGYNVPVEWVIDQTGIPVEEKEMPEQLEVGPADPDDEDPDGDPEAPDDEPVPEDVQNHAMYRRMVAMYGKRTAKKQFFKIFKIKNRK